MNGKKAKSRIVTRFRIPVELHAALKAISAARGESMAKTIEYAITWQIAQAKKDPASDETNAA